MFKALFGITGFSDIPNSVLVSTRASRPGSVFAIARGRRWPGSAFAIARESRWLGSAFVIARESRWLGSAFVIARESRWLGSAFVIARESRWLGSAFVKARESRWLGSAFVKARESMELGFNIKAKRSNAELCLKAFCLSSACVAGLGVLSVNAQGVPIVDVPKTAINIQMLTETLLKGTEYGKNIAKNQSITALHQDQLAQMDATLAILRQTEGFTAALNTYDGIAVTEVYAIADNNPYAERLFGDARVTIEQMIVETAQKYGNHPALQRAGINPVEFRCWFQALIKQESRFSIGARSPKAAFGLTQIIPPTARYLGIYPEYYKNPRLQLDGGARYLLEQLNKFGSMPFALAAYNAGPGAVQKYSGIPPYKETQNYVVKISGYYNAYAAHITGVDMVGTLSLQDMTLAESSNLSDAGLYYADHASHLIATAMGRLKGIITQIPSPKGVKDAIDLNTYARAEVTRIAALLLRLQAAQRKIEYARYALLLAALVEDARYLQLGSAQNDG